MLRARAEEGLASALFLLRSDLSAAPDHARAAVALAEQVGDTGMQIAALSQFGLVDAVTGGNEWRAALRARPGARGAHGARSDRRQRDLRSRRRPDLG